jgi:hypothetical protein
MRYKADITAGALKVGGALCTSVDPSCPLLHATEHHGFCRLASVLLRGPEDVVSTAFDCEGAATTARRGTELVSLTFDHHIGIDSSGRETPTSRTPALQVYAAFDTEEPRRILSPSSTEKTYQNWCRKEIAEWLTEQARSGKRFIAGIDHGFSFPINYFNRYKLTSWPKFLDDFCKHWPTDDDHTTSISCVTVTKAIIDAVGPYTLRFERDR